MSEKLIGLTVLSVGTSLPELATSTVAAYRNNAEIAIGNVVGSNIFNLALILGISGLIYPPAYDTLLNEDVLAMIICTLLLLLAMFSGGKMKLDRWEAAILLGFYLVYTVFIIYRN